MIGGAHDLHTTEQFQILLRLCLCLEQNIAAILHNIVCIVFGTLIAAQPLIQRMNCPPLLFCSHAQNTARVSQK